MLTYRDMPNVNINFQTLGGIAVHPQILGVPYETHSAVKRPNAFLCKDMRSATDKSKINNGCMQKHKREKEATLFLQ